MDTYAGSSDNYVAAVRYATDGDPPTEADMVFPPVQDLADRTETIKDGSLVMAGDKIFTGTVSILSQMLWPQTLLTDDAQTLEFGNSATPSWGGFPVYLIPSTLDVDATVYTLDHSPAPRTGTIIVLYRVSANANGALIQQDGSTIAEFPASQDHSWAVMAYDFVSGVGNRWHVLMYGGGTVLYGL